MNKKIWIRIVLIIVFGISVVLFTLVKSLDDSSLTYTMDKQLTMLNDNMSINTKSVLQDIGEKSSLNSITKPSDTESITPYDFNNRMGSLSATSIIISPLEKYNDGVGITFNLDVYSETVEIIVLDDVKSLVNKFLVNVTTMDVIDSSGIHSVNVYKTSLNGLEANNLYYYAIHLDKAYSKLYEFSTIKDQEATTLAFFGDTQGYMSSQYEAFRTSYEVALKVAGEDDKSIDLTYIAGDIVDDGGNYEQWKFFYNNMEGVLSEHQFISAIGNHDVHNGADIYTNSFNYPNNGLPSLIERSYYIDLPYARVAVFDTESISTFPEQSEWLLNIMGQSNQAFRIVLMHRSAYPMAYNEAYIRQLSEVFEAANINLVLSGHDHIYSRTTMEADKQVAIEDGVTYIVGGSSTGSKFYETLDEDSRYWKNVVFDENYPVFTLLEIDEKAIRVKAYSIQEDDVQVIDSFIVNE